MRRELFGRETPPLNGEAALAQKDSISALIIRTTIVQVHASPTNIFVLVLVLVLDYRVFDYENEDNVVAAQAPSSAFIPFPPFCSIPA